MDELNEILSEAIDKGNLKKITLSRPYDKKVLRTCASLFKNGNETFVQLESFLSDNKAVHKNIPAKEAPEFIEHMILNDYAQSNIITHSGECEVKVSKKGKVFIGNRIKKTNKEYDAPSHNRKKAYILDSVQANDFLYKLGISDKNGRIFDKKSSKYKQINRFLEILDDVYDTLPKEGEIFALDLCCGKSYLTFAVYFYLHTVKKRSVHICGIDLKQDCVDYCNSVANELGFSDIEFLCMDILKYEPTRNPDMVISLHACDIATDITLAKAIKCDAKLILSTPCCHHEMFNQIKCSPLDFIEKHSMLKQKLCDAATDALRAKMLEVFNYKVSVLELIDPEDTPKNLLIRAIRNGKVTADEGKLYEYKECCKFLGAEPYLYKLLFQSDSEKQSF